MPAWVKDEKTWQKAKDAVRKDWNKYDEPHAIVVHVYKKMGGTVSGKEVALPSLSTDDKDMMTRSLQSLFNKKAEAVGSQGQSSILRAKARPKWTESYKSFSRLSEASVDRAKREVRSIIISEGPGNLRDRNYYTAEAIVEAVQTFNGRRAYINHQSDRERSERPEEDIKRLCGFWKDCRSVDVVNELGRPVKAIEGTLVCDKSPAGDEALAKAEASILYRQVFPELSEVYSGISINADGDADGLIDVGGMEYHAIKRIVNVDSADVVTRPARGGAFVKILESVSGGKKLSQKEERIMRVKELSEVAVKMTEAAKNLSSETDEEKKKGLMAEMDELAKRAKALSSESEDESEGEDEAGKNKEGDGSDGSDDSSKDGAGDSGDDGSGDGSTDGGNTDAGDGEEEGEKKEGEGEDEAESEAEAMKEIKALMPPKEDEAEADYEARVAQAIKTARGMKSKQSESMKESGGTVKEFMKIHPSRYNAIVAHVREAFKEEKKDFTKLKTQLRESRAEATILRDTLKAKELLEAAKIPDRILSPSDLVGKDEKEMKREIAKMKGLLEGKSGFGGNPARSASESAGGGLTPVDFKSYGIPTIEAAK